MRWIVDPHLAFKRGVGADIVKKSKKTPLCGPKWKGPEWFSILAEKLQIFKWASFLTKNVSTCYEMDPRPPFAFERGIGADIVKNQINTTFGPKWQGPEWFSILAEKLQIFKWASFLTMKCLYMPWDGYWDPHLPLKGV